MDIGEAAFLAGVEVFTSAEPFGHSRFDVGLDSADTIIGNKVSGEIFGSVGEAEADRCRLVECFVGDLAPQLVNVENVSSEVVDDGAVLCGAVLPCAVGCLWPVRPDWSCSDDGAACAALGAVGGFDVGIGSATAAHCGVLSGLIPWLSKLRVGGPHPGPILNIDL